MPNKICPNCHSAIPEDSKFCFVCGSKLEESARYSYQQVQNQQQYQSAPQNVAQMPPQQQQPYMPNNLSGNYNGKGTNKGIIVLIAFGIVVLVGIIILLTLLLLRGSDKAQQTVAPAADTTAIVTKTDTVYQTTVIQQPASEPVYQPTFQEGGTFKFSGSIPGAGNIRMTLTNNNGNVSGSYYYTKVGTPIYLTGYLNGNQLSLSSQYDSWEGTITGRRYSGSFYNLETGRTFRFNTKY